MEPRRPPSAGRRPIADQTPNTQYRPPRQRGDGSGLTQSAAETPAGLELRVTLRQLRREQGLSQRDLLKPLSLASHSVIADYESGKRLPAPDILSAYERCFQLRAASLHRLRQRALAERAAAEAGDGRWHNALFAAEPASATVVTPRQLPADVADFTGRRTELDAVGADGRPVTIIAGPPGIGKTVFAVHMGHQRRDRYPDGQLFANMHGYEEVPTRPADVLGRFLRALGVPIDQVPADPEEREALYRSVTATSRLLVVVDNARDETQVRCLLPAGPGCDVLITSRSLLPGIEGAARLRLAVPPMEDALALLARIAGTAQIASNRQTARQIAELCGLLPLAVRIAGARLASQPDLPPVELAKTLADERTRLRELAAGDLDVRAVFDLSYQMLDRAQRQIYALLGVVPVHSFTVGAISALSALPAARCAPLLESFAELSLVQAVAQGRYQLHDLLRLYASERATVSTDEAARTAAVERLVTWYLGAADL